VSTGVLKIFQKMWECHSLTIVLTGLGLVLSALATAFVWPLEADRWFDLLSGLGAGFLTVALFQWLSGPLVERNKPEEPPDLTDEGDDQ
jgi:hypothetical protein